MCFIITKLDVGAKVFRLNVFKTKFKKKCSVEIIPLF